MKEIGSFRWFSQYGFETDVFDTYREAVRRSNRQSIQVMSVTGIVISLVTIAYGLTTQQATDGLWFCLALLLASSLAAVVALRKHTPRGLLLGAGYLLSAAFYSLSIYGSLALNTDAFWIGTQVAIGCYILDYAWRMGAMQILSYLALMVIWIADRAEVTDNRFLFSVMFLAIGLVTFYTMNRTRVSLIIGREESRKQADTDLLTGLMNRTAAKEDIEEHLADTQETGVLMLLDLDRFKSVNDRLGHQMGDKVLKDVAEDLKKMFRNTDVISRLGGDEFIIYMKAVPEEDWVRKRAEEVVRTVRRWVTDGTTNIQVSASVGVVTTNGMERIYEDMYRAADIAMYFSKGQGGNQAIFYSKDLVSQARAVPPSTREEQAGDADVKTLAEHNGIQEDKASEE